MERTSLVPLATSPRFALCLPRRAAGSSAARGVPLILRPDVPHDPSSSRTLGVRVLAGGLAIGEASTSEPEGCYTSPSTLYVRQHRKEEAP